jgi:hypothetical protein
MHSALMEALYERPRAFQWVHFTPHGTIRGAMSPACYGWHPIQPYAVRNAYTEWAQTQALGR